MTSRHPANGPKNPATPLNVVTRFQVGDHVVRVSKVMEGRWVVAVDEASLPGSYGNQAEAWEAGVREVDRISRQPPPA